MFEFEEKDKKPKKVKPVGKTPGQIVGRRLGELGKNAPGGLLISDAGIQTMVEEARVETSRRRKVVPIRPEDF
ncbi:hypothetical protein A2574_00790 [Candidatus Shapirobacteria bacterium RIFOXYD1_FULL_38_32]|uniref:Uncharacterized protein n=2 Tax=Candidatus Shapironibacteriota TaxID=1752721 RepID=A0A0G0M6T7_9BACT|nr:MAG: hypothetical protein US90_C0017G0008 [Candidatus Shapirobacteria bacterium GW2011_GWE2_38_30]KKQ89442.1 MAG: hypothetical protein UT14_C0058G0005 [Candidatus Shapirobacteria bacterium GW2011_GWE1_38_92]OGL56379.1 MAG: hypothetical protein A2195_03270 [Candidatus Shapirobacteria bacterium RIFOXYA1_FULL_39_17]OGL56608.1 MAG: hypothetical protein A2410_01055 [Candidatus Shapirobacteria bacterium RIFOXYC1_FULL_38_24]OGL57998.1 MAG: hypothetical protein A2574_00790 [Candidatus Shapirobacteri